MIIFLLEQKLLPIWLADKSITFKLFKPLNNPGLKFFKKFSSNQRFSSRIKFEKTFAWKFSIWLLDKSSNINFNPENKYSSKYFNLLYDKYIFFNLFNPLNILAGIAVKRLFVGLSNVYSEGRKYRKLKHLPYISLFFL